MHGKGATVRVLTPAATDELREHLGMHYTTLALYTTLFGMLNLKRSMLLSGCIIQRWRCKLHLVHNNDDIRAL